MDDLGSLSTTELQKLLEKLRGQLASTEGYLASNTKALKKVRQMRGADAYKKRWEFEAHIEKNNAQVEEVNGEIALVTAELAVRDP